jgi:drug/metabolite transporter superfamily protein YnfA
MAYRGSKLETLVLKGFAIAIAFMLSLSYAAGLPPDWPGHMYVAMGGIFITVLFFTMKNLLAEDSASQTWDRRRGALRTAHRKSGPD